MNSSICFLFFIDFAPFYFTIIRLQDEKADEMNEDAVSPTKSKSSTSNNNNNNNNSSIANSRPTRKGASKHSTRGVEGMRSTKGGSSNNTSVGSGSNRQRGAPPGNSRGGSNNNGGAVNFLDNTVAPDKILDKDYIGRREI